MTATGHIRKRGESFQVVVELPTTTSGKRRRIYKTVKGSKKQAEGVLRQLLQEIEGQSYIRPSKITVAEWIHQWLNLYIEGSRSVTTVEGYRNQIEKYIIPTLGDIFLQDLSPSMVQRWINDLREKSPRSGKPLSPKTIRNIGLNLYTAMEKAVMEELVKKNPCDYTELPPRE